jgi:hypothetical protein
MPDNLDAFRTWWNSLAYQRKVDYESASRAWFACAASKEAEIANLRDALLLAGIPLEALRIASEQDRQRNANAGGKWVGFLTEEIHSAIIEATNSIRTLLTTPPTGDGEQPGKESA